MANNENLVDLRTRTTEEQREIARMGGIASGKARAARKTFKEELLLLLANGDTQEKISLALLQKAMNGDTKAFEVLRDTVGEKPKEEIEVTDVTNKKFDEICSQVGGKGLDE